MFITDNSHIEVHTLSGAGIMNGTINATALVEDAVLMGSSGRELRGVKLTTTAAHGLVAKSGDALIISGLNNANYKTNRNRELVLTPTTTTMTILTREAFVAATPAGTETWAAGFSCQDPWFLLGFKIHLSAADTNGETLTLTADADAGSSWDHLIYSKVMTGVTDIIYFPDIPIPMNRKDMAKFSWTNTGAKTWGLEMWVQTTR